MKTVTTTRAAPGDKILIGNQGGLATLTVVSAPDPWPTEGADDLGEVVWATQDVDGSRFFAIPVEDVLGWSV